MAGKVWQPGNAKKFARAAKLGTRYYTVNDHALNLGPYEDAQTYSEHVFTRHAPLTGSKMTDGGTSATRLCQLFGPVYDSPPRGLRNLDGPSPQVAGPLPAGYEGVLDEDEIRGLEKLNGRSLPPKLRRALNAHRP